MESFQEISLKRNIGVAADDWLLEKIVIKCIKAGVHPMMFFFPLFPIAGCSFCLGESASCFKI